MKPQFLIAAPHSGSGKTTLLGLMLGLLRPSQGDVTLNDVPSTDFFGNYSIR